MPSSSQENFKKTMMTTTDVAMPMNKMYNHEKRKKADKHFPVFLNRSQFVNLKIVSSQKKAMTLKINGMQQATKPIIR